MFQRLWIVCFMFLFAVSSAAVQGPADGTHFIVGSTESYTHGTDSAADFLIYRVDAAGNKLWRKNLGGDEFDYLWTFSHTPTTDNGIIVAGISRSYTHGGDDMLVYKLDAAGAKQWRKNYGGTLDDEAYAIIQTTDGGYLLAGRSYSYSNGGRDFLVYKLSASGAKQWRKNYGGSNSDNCYSVAQTADGGYILAGYGYSYIHDPGINGLNKAGSPADFLVYKIDAGGAKQWRKNYGGSESEYGRCVAVTTDGGYIIFGKGYTYTHGGSDMLAYKVDAAGAKQWRKNYGGLRDDRGWSVAQTTDGGYVLAGSSDSFSGDEYEMLVYKIDAAGAKQWRKRYGGVDPDYGYLIYQTADGGFFLQGDTYTYGEGGDFLVYRLDANGAKLWRKNYGGSGEEWCWD